MGDVLKPVALMAEASLRAWAGMRMALSSRLFLVTSPLRRRAWACVPELFGRLCELRAFRDLWPRGALQLHALLEPCVLRRHGPAECLGVASRQGSLPRVLTAALVDATH